MKHWRFLPLAALLCALPASAADPACGLSDVTQPTDPIVASSANSPGSEGAANAIDNAPTKYLNFDAADGTDVGFVVSPSVGLTHVTGLAMQSANDAPERDPGIVALEGSNADAAPAWNDATWEPIVQITVPAFTERFQWQTFYFENWKPYKHYRWVVLEVQNVAAANSMQVAEVELLGKAVPSDVTQPGDPILGSSANSPGSEGAANAIDNAPTKYLNFDAADGTDVGFVVSPSIGRTLVTGMSIQSANDAPERDPHIVALEGSNAETAPAWNDAESWEPITQITLEPFTARFQVQSFLFENYVPYRHYRWVVLEVANIPAANSMQVAEVELLGTSEPKDVLQPTDPIVASSANSPGSEGVANAIDNAPTKYLNFDAADGTDVGFVVTPSVGATTVIGITIQSANDAPERDPRFVALEGSNAETAPAWNDAAAWEPIVEIEFPPFTARFQIQEVFFPNTKCYLHYRWVVQEVQDVASANSMQVAEVELLAVTDQADCEKARILTMPANTPVLSGEPATFFTVVNGPWPVQWYRNGTRIPGATQLIYTTPPITAANAGDVYSVEIVGCEMSPEVQAVLFTPSETKSIGLSFEGGGANGAPTPILPEDIAGVHLQAYWNNVTNAASGTLTSLVDSDNSASTITVQFASSGTWGAGTGNIIPQQRLLNGLIYDNPGGDPGQIQFQNVPAGEHTVIAYTVGIPLQFQEQNYWIADSVTGNPLRQVYTLQMNADQYNPNPTFVRGTSPDPDSRTLANYVRLEKLQPDSAGNITLRWTTATTGFDRGVAINAVQLLLNPPELGEPPILVRGPRPTETLAGGTVVMDVLATGEGLTYRWRKNGVNLPGSSRISGVNSPELTIRQFGPADVGFYSVLVENEAGNIITSAVKAKIVPPDRAITDTLIAHFRFDETSGMNVANSGSDPHNGMIDGFASWVPGRVANSIELAGGSWVFVPNYTKITEEVTIAGWVYLEPGSSSSVVLIRNASGAIGVAAPQEQFDFGFVADTSDPLNPRLNLRVTIAAGPNLTTVRENAAMPTGEWQHVAFTADGGQVRLYRNGQLVAAGAYLDPINRGDIEWLSIGARLVETGGVVTLDEENFQALSGRIDDLAIWRTAWSQEVIQSIHQQGLLGQNLTTATVPEPPPVPTDILLSVGLQENGSIAVSWTPEQGVLQSTSNAADPASWTPVAGNPNPHVIPSPQGNQFFRVLLSQ
jgi:hypothetical protein